MRHTLIPLRERRLLRREYRVRALIVFFFTLAVAGLIGVGSLLPSYIRASIEEQLQQKNVSKLKEKAGASAIAATERDLAADAQILASFGDELSNARISDFISSIGSLRGPLKINSLIFARTGTSTVTMTVQGLAPSREGLLAFKSRLESAYGSKVELPISELTKSKDIPFSLQVAARLP